MVRMQRPTSQKVSTFSLPELHVHVPYVVNWVSISNEFWFFHIFDVWLCTGDIHVHVRCSNLPIGVLYDYHSKHVSLPWKLIIHFRKFPGNKVSFFYCFRISWAIIYSTLIITVNSCVDSERYRKVVLTCTETIRIFTKWKYSTIY
jgi:hypothetical protein